MKATKSVIQTKNKSCEVTLEDEIQMWINKDGQLINIVFYPDEIAIAAFTTKKVTKKTYRSDK